MEPTTSLGEGIGLQQGNNRDDFWAKQIYARGVEKKAEKKQKEADFIKLTDIKTDYAKQLPYYAKKSAAILRDYVAKAALERQRNPNNYMNVIADDTYKTHMALGNLEQNNARAMAKIADKESVLPPEYLSIMTSPDTTDEQWASMNDGQFFMTDANGTFASRPFKESDLTSKLKWGDFSEKNIPTGKHENLGNTRWEEVMSSHGDSSIKDQALHLASTPELKDQVRWDTRLWQQEPNETVADFKQRKVDYANDLALKIAENNVPHPKVERIARAIPQGRAEDKKKEPSSLFDRAEYSVPVTIIDRKTNKPAETIVAAKVNLGNKDIKPITVSNSSDIFEVETNDKINNGNPTNIQFKPDNLEYKMIEKNGKKEHKWYVSGVGVDIAKASNIPKREEYAQGDAGQKEYDDAITQAYMDATLTKGGTREGAKKTTFNVMIPLSQVSGQLKDFYKLNELKAIEEEYQRRSGSRGGGQSKPIGNKSYTQKATTPDGKTYYSANGKDWFDDKGNPVK